MLAAQRDGTLVVVVLGAGLAAFCLVTAGRETRIGNRAGLRRDVDHLLAPAGATRVALVVVVRHQASHPLSSSSAVTI